MTPQQRAVAYLDALGGADLSTMPGLFSDGALVHSPLHGGAGRARLAGLSGHWLAHNGLVLTAIAVPRARRELVPHADREPAHR